MGGSGYQGWSREADGLDLKSIKTIFADSYRSDKIAFYPEMTDFAFSNLLMKSFSSSV